MDELDFSLLGLTKWESALYQALIRLGKAGATELSRESGVPYGRTYDTLNALINKQLAKMIPEKSKKFVAGNPSLLQEMLQKKEKEQAQVQKRIALLQSQFQEQEEVDHEIITVARGRRNFYKELNNLPWAKTFSYEVKATAEFRPEFVKVSKENVQKGVEIKQLINASDDTKKNIVKWKKILPQLKIKEFNSHQIALNVTDDYVWVGLLEANTLVVIKDKNFVHVMKQLFESQYRNT